MRRARLRTSPCPRARAPFRELVRATPRARSRDQSWSAPANGTSTSPGRASPPTSTATSQAASSSRLRSRASSRRPAGASTRRSSASCSRASRARSAPGVSDVNAAERTEARPRARADSRCVAQPRSTRRRAHRAPRPSRRSRARAPRPRARAAPRARRASRRRRASRAATRIVCAGGAMPRTVPEPARLERRVVAEDRLLELLERRARLEAELLDEARSGRPVHLERLRLAAAAVEREHAQRLEALAQRVLGRQRLELADELGLPRRTLDPPRCAARARRAGARRAVPPRVAGRRPRRRLRARRRSRAPRASRRRSAATRRLALLERARAFRRETLETVQVERATPDVDRVPRLARLDDLSAERLAELRDVALEDVRRRRRVDRRPTGRRSRRAAGTTWPAWSSSIARTARGCGARRAGLPSMTRLDGAQHAELRRHAATVPPRRARVLAALQRPSSRPTAGACGSFGLDDATRCRVTVEEVGDESIGRTTSTFMVGRRRGGARDRLARSSGTGVEAAHGDGEADVVDEQKGMYQMHGSLVGALEHHGLQAGLAGSGRPVRRERQGDVQGVPRHRSQRRLRRR